jgi:hypothetical protein
MNTRTNDEYDVDDDDFNDDDSLERYGRGGFEKTNKSGNTGKLCNKKKIKPRQVADTDSY